MANKKLTLYLDTSVIGGYYDSQFEAETKLLFQNIKDEKYIVLISDLTIKELLRAPENVRNLLTDLSIKFQPVQVTVESIGLADEYIKEKVVGSTSRDDCIHIATATISKVDVLVSWNFKHIVNIQRIRGYNSINIKNGYGQLEIRSPREVVLYEQ
jgi:predicted nucleic acid-binding protein